MRVYMDKRRRHDVSMPFVKKQKVAESTADEDFSYCILHLDRLATHFPDNG